MQVNLSRLSPERPPKGRKETRAVLELKVNFVALREHVSHCEGNADWQRGNRHRRKQILEGLQVQVPAADGGGRHAGEVG